MTEDNRPPGTDEWGPLPRALYEYWAARCRDGRLPSREDVDPIEIPDLLPSLFLVDVVREGGDLRFRYRLVGTRNVERFGVDNTGRWLDELYGKDYFKFVGSEYQDTTIQGKPTWARMTAGYADRPHVVYERLMCPLAADGRTVDMLMGITDFSQGHD